MDRQGRTEKKDKTLGAAKCENIGNMYINK